jgi:hypothetical protein
MKKNVIAFILVVLLGGISFWLLKKNGTSTVPKELRDFAVSDTASITKIFLADKANKSITLEKIKPGKWKLDGKWAARNDGIQNLMFVIKNLSIRSMVGVPAVENVIKNLASGAVKIEIYKGNKLVKMYYVGGATPDDLGTYMLLADPDTKQNSSRPFVMCIEGQNRYLTPVYATDISDWRDRNAISCNPGDIRSLKLEQIENPQGSFEIQVPSPNTFKVHSLWTNADLPNVDTLAVKQYLSYFQNVNFEAFLSDMKPAHRDSILHSNPIQILTITDKDGQVNRIKLYHMEPVGDMVDEHGHPEKYNVDHMYALMNNGEIVSVQFYVFGKLIPDIEYFATQHRDVKK